eukprot:GEZU01014190.1.p2 GENE.GEZU01014190.1~~GEZU01014190.1.p2  ORF type:complete len:302 (+),score=95.77 GEZU01014190.1:76-981(+)
MAAPASTITTATDSAAETKTITIKPISLRHNSFDALNNSVKDMKDFCKHFKLPVAGTNNALKERLISFLVDGRDAKIDLNVVRKDWNSAPNWWEKDKKQKLILSKLGLPESTDADLVEEMLKFGVRGVALALDVVAHPALARHVGNPNAKKNQKYILMVNLLEKYEKESAATITASTTTTTPSPAPSDVSSTTTVEQTTSNKKRDASKISTSSEEGGSITTTITTADKENAKKQEQEEGEETDTTKRARKDADDTEPTTEAAATTTTTTANGNDKEEEETNSSRNTETKTRDNSTKSDDDV